MKYLNTYEVFERLSDETYLSAADRLSRNHPERSNKLRKWVDDKQNVDINYLDPRPMEAMGGNYYITNVTLQDYMDEPQSNIVVDLESVSDAYNLSILNFNSGRASSLGLEYHLSYYGNPWGPPGYSKKGDDSTLGAVGNEFPTEFFFSDRKSARIFMDIVEKESGQKLLFSVNDIYRS